MSSNKEIFDTAARALNDFKGKVVLKISDFQQTLPVVVNGENDEILAATIVNHDAFKGMKQLHLMTNMRLATASARNQKYLNMISAVARNKESALNRVICEDSDQDPDFCLHVLSNKIQSYFDFEAVSADEGIIASETGLAGDDFESLDNGSGGDKGEKWRREDYLNAFLGTTASEREAFLTDEFKSAHGMEALIEKLFPGKLFSADTASKVSILAVSNKEVDQWNSYIGDLNPAEEVELKSKDYFSEVQFIY
jgi:hypothetical protein